MIACPRCHTWKHPGQMTIGGTVCRDCYDSIIAAQRVKPRAYAAKRVKVNDVVISARKLAQMQAEAAAQVVPDNVPDQVPSKPQIIPHQESRSDLCPWMNHRIEAATGRELPQEILSPLMNPWG